MDGVKALVVLASIYYPGDGIVAILVALGRDPYCARSTLEKKWLQVP